MNRSTAVLDLARNNVNASTKYTPNRDGNTRNRCSSRPATTNTSSTNPGDTNGVKIPNPTRDNNRPTGENHPDDMTT
jgi:hypothetical protein